MTAPDEEATWRAAVAQRDQRDSQVVGLISRAKRAGFALHLLDAGNGTCVYVVTRWGLMTELPTLADVEAFLTRIGAPP